MFLKRKEFKRILEGKFSNFYQINLQDPHSKEE
jgi:hypothetical protein